MTERSIAPSHGEPKQDARDAILYVVLCGCDGDGTTQRIIAWIDDDRTNGGRVSVQSNVSFTQHHHEDGHVVWNIRCRACRKWVMWSETTVGEVLDRIAPIRNQLELQKIPALSQPLVLDEPARAEVQGRIDEFMAQLSADPGKRQLPQLVGPDPIIPNATVYEMRYVLPFDVLCNIVTALRNDT